MIVGNPVWERGILCGNGSAIMKLHANYPLCLHSETFGKFRVGCSFCYVHCPMAVQNSAEYSLLYLWYYISVSVNFK